MSATHSLQRARRVRVRPILAAAAALGLGAMLTMAAFTDDGYVGATFSTGSVDISFDTPAGANQGPVGTPYAFTSLGISAGKLGSTAVAPLQINNSGTLPFTYNMTATTSGSTTLAAALRVTIAAGATTCSGTTLTGGTPLVTDVTLAAATFAASRALAAGANEILCFKVTLPDIPANDVSTLQGVSTTATFRFTATQS